MMIRDVRPEDTESWLVMRMALWPETDEPQHRREMAMMLSDDERFAVFWGLMGLLFGPLAIPFALLARPKRRE